MKLFPENSLLIFRLTGGLRGLKQSYTKKKVRKNNANSRKDKSKYISGPSVTFHIVNTAQAIVLMDMHLADHIRDLGDLENAIF